MATCPEASGVFASTPFSSSAEMQQQRLFMTLSLKYQLVATNQTKCALKSRFLIVALEQRALHVVSEALLFLM